MTWKSTFGELNLTNAIAKLPQAQLNRDLLFVNPTAPEFARIHQRLQICRMVILEFTTTSSKMSIFLVT